MTKKLLWILPIVALSTHVFAGDWKLITREDAMTDQVTKEAMVTAPGGEKFSVLRRSDGRVWGYFQLAGLDQFSVGERLMLRIDKNEPQEFNEDLHNVMKSLGSPEGAWEWNPNLIGFLIWHGEAKSGCGMLRTLYEGHQVIIRYHPNQSTVRDVVFPLTGNKKALSEAMDVDLSKCNISNL